MEAKIPEIDLNALTIEELEGDVIPSNIYKEIDVLRIIIAKQKCENVKLREENEQIRQLDRQFSFSRKRW